MNFKKYWFAALLLATTSLPCHAMFTDDDPNIFNNPKLRAEIGQWFDRHVFSWLLDPAALNAPNIPNGGLGLPRNAHQGLNPIVPALIAKTVTFSLFYNPYK